MSEEKKELKEAEAEKVTGGAFIRDIPQGVKAHIPPFCDSMDECIGNICPEYKSCTKSIKK